MAQLRRAVGFDEIDRRAAKFAIRHRVPVRHAILLGRQGYPSRTRDATSRPTSSGI
jgi:hypothetical protein